MKQNYLTKSKFLVALFFLVIKLSGQQTYTFTNCGATGSVGPTQAQVNSTYSNTNLSGLVTTTTNGIQTWTVPYTGNFRIEARGAQGGTSGSGGGLGATMIGDFTLTVGEVIQILVGQVGDNGGTGPGGGGGGSFVVRTPYTTTSSILVIAGGGSGAGSYSFTPGVNTTTGVTGGVAGGTNGSGGLGGTRGAGGGGFLTDGAPCSVNTIYASPGQAFVNGGEGGPVTNNTTCNFTANGGFGGGSSHGGNCINNGGAGGGFSGGGGSSNTTSGGGGSFNAGTNQTNTSGANTGDGRVIITELCNIRIFSSGTNSTNPTICSGQSLTLTTTAVSNYTWSNGNTTTTSIVVSPTSSQSYSIIGTSSLACQAVANISVTVSSGLPVLTITNAPNTICLGKTATLTAGGALSYTWSGGSVPVTNGQSFLPTATTTYTVAGQNGCGISTSTTAITIAPLVVTASANPALVCAGSPATLTAVSSVNGYTWTPSNSVINPAVVGPTVNTIYTVAASDGTCFGTATVAVNTKPNPTITIASSSSVVCEGAVVTMTASGGLSYVWTPGNSTTAAISDNPISPTLYQVVGTSSNGCTAQASQIVLTNTAPIVMVSSNKTIVCSGDPAILTASGANAYNWTNGPSTAVNQVNPTAPSVYTVTGIGSNSCTATKTIAVNVLAANVSASSSTSSICNGGTTTLTASGANTYVWVGTPSFLGVAFVSPTVTTNYSVNANTTITGLSCPSSTNITITVFNNPTVTILATKTVVCKSDPAITLTGTGAVTYTWSTNATSLAISVKPQVTTTYTVSGTDANGCKNTAAKQIVVNACTSVGELSGAEKGLNVYPNPSNGIFVVSSEADLDLSILNELGQVIRTIKLSAQNNHTVQVDDLANGVYFIVGQNNDLKTNQKIIIAK